MRTLNNATAIRRKIMTAVGKACFEGKLPESVERVPLDLVPKGSEPARCCVYKDRAIIKYRCMAAMGFGVEDEERGGRDELTPLNEYARKALDRKTIRGPALTVLDVACSACVQSYYLVTEACHGCLARPCVSSCPKGAVSIVNGRSRIDSSKCVKCGRCAQVCPYSAIVRVPIPCEEACPVGAISKDDTGKERIDYAKCVFCGNCVKACPFDAIMEKSQIVDVANSLCQGKKVVALVAPSIVGQFKAGLDNLAGAMVALGFESMVEAALGADRVTETEGEEFIARMSNGEPFMTSSCCPAYYETVRKMAPDLKPYVSKSDTPMALAGAMIKAENPDVSVAFIGPCFAKRKEAYGLKAIDYVLTFEELACLFDAKNIKPEDAAPVALSRPARVEGRAFPVSGGIGQSVSRYVGDRAETRVERINGLDKKVVRRLKSLAKGGCPNNFIEVMACEGGCVAGPGVIEFPKVAASRVEKLLGESAPLDSVSVKEEKQSEKP